VTFSRTKSFRKRAAEFVGLTIFFLPVVGLIELPFGFPTPGAILAGFVVKTFFDQGWRIDILFLVWLPTDAALYAALSLFLYRKVAASIKGRLSTSKRRRSLQ
jgi:hypothetical protein